MAEHQPLVCEDHVHLRTPRERSVTEESWDLAELMTVDDDNLVFLCFFQHYSSHSETIKGLCNDELYSHELNSELAKSVAEKSWGFRQTHDSG